MIFAQGTGLKFMIKSASENDTVVLKRTYRRLQLILPDVNPAPGANTEYFERRDLVSRATDLPRYVSAIGLHPETEEVASAPRTSIVRKVSRVDPL